MEVYREDHYYGGKTRDLPFLQWGGDHEGIYKRKIRK